MPSVEIPETSNETAVKNPTVAIPETLRFFEVRSVVEVIPNVEVPETSNELAKVIPKDEIPEILVFPITSNTNLFSV